MNDFARTWIRSPIVVIVWCAFVAAITLTTWGYDVTPGPDVAVPEVWPSETAIAAPRIGTGSRLMCFLHPKCGCSAVTVNCLKQLLTEHDSKNRPEVLFVCYSPSSHSGWTDEAMLKSCRDVPGASVFLDTDGADARRFGIRTSGHVLLYSSEGRLLFGGGLTASRGHAGPSAGQDALRECLRTSVATDRRYPVFGCSIQANGLSNLRSEIPSQSRACGKHLN